MNASEAYREFLGRQVVLDVAPPVVYLGRLAEVNDFFLVLEEADVHDMQSSAVSKEIYVMEAHRNGITPTRRRVCLKQSDVLSISRVDDIILF